MTEREKKLLIFLGVTFFIILNFIGYSVLYAPALKAARSQERIAKQEYQVAESTLSLADKFVPEMEWLEKSGTAVTTAPEARSKLEALLRNQAQARKLEIRDSRILDTQVGEYFDRVKVRIKVTGMERDVLSWLTSIHQIAQRQVVTKLDLNPQNNDITRIEVEVEVEKWIITPDDEA